MKKILFVRPWGIGNVIMATPALLALKKIYPDSIIDFLGTEPGIQSIRGCPLIREALLENPIKQEYNLAFQCHPGTRYWPFYNCDKNIFFEKDNYEINEVRSNLDLVARLGDIGDYSQYKPFFYLPEADPEFLLLTPSYLNNVAINIGPGKDDRNLSGRKKWDLERWIKIIEHLIFKKYCVILLGTLDQKEEYSEIIKRFPVDHVYDYSGLTTLRQVASIIRQSRFMISIDSGLAHISASLGIPVITLFGPTLPEKNAPYGFENLAIRRPCQCQYWPCYRSGQYQAEGCPGICMDAIQVEDVIDKMDGLKFKK